MDEDDVLEIKEASDEIVFSVADFIKRRRLEKGINLDTMAELSGVERSYANKIENGGRKGVTFRVINKLVMALGGEIIVKIRD